MVISSKKKNENLMRFSVLFQSEYKYILYLRTMYVYFKYLATFCQISVNRKIQKIPTRFDADVIEDTL